MGQGAPRAAGQHRDETLARILIVEDDGDIMAANRDLLELAGYEVACARTLAAGREAVAREQPDLVILDILLPDGSGLDLCRELREESDVRILFLSALNTPTDVVEGLRRGGDDYLGKPYLTDELLLRVEALLRRGARLARPREARTGPLEWHDSAHQVFVGGHDLLLSPHEYAVLELLCGVRGSWLTAEELFRGAWNADPNGDVHAVHNHISSLRRKLAPYGVAIESRRGQGYRVTW
ncbi:MAG: response regulator transcription factor [Atopobiaceae bacterium]|jgi:DNA-binding response OmpR family regulator|nr:response regulator transcription factor [Atopobiaceae bacterium]